MTDTKTGNQLLWRSTLQFCIGPLIPIYKTLLRWFLFLRLTLFPLRRSLSVSLQILDEIFRSLGHNVANIIKSPPPRSTANLTEVANC